MSLLAIILRKRGEAHVLQGEMLQRWDDPSQSNVDFTARPRFSMASRSRNSTRAHSACASHEVNGAVAPEELQTQARAQATRWSTAAAAFVRSGELACQLQLNALQRIGQRLRQFSSGASESHTAVDLAMAQLELAMSGSLDSVHIAHDLSNMWLQLDPTEMSHRPADAAALAGGSFAPWLRAWQQTWQQTQQFANAAAEQASASVH